MPVTTQQVTADPNFLKLPPEAKRDVLTRIDPKFKALPSDAQNDVVKSFGGLPGIPKPPNPIQDQIDKEKRGNPFALHPVLFNEGFEQEGRKQIEDFGKNLGRQVVQLPKTMIHSVLHPLEADAQANANTVGLVQQSVIAGGGHKLPSLVAGADVLAGGNPVEGSANFKKGETGKALADFLAVPALNFAAGKVINELPSLITKDPEVFTPSNRANLAALLTDNQESTSYLLERGGFVDQLFPYLRMAAKELNFKSNDRKNIFPSREVEPGNPVKSIAEAMKNQKTGDFRVDRGVEARYDLFDKTEEIFDRQFEMLMREYGTSPVDVGKTTKSIMGSITPAEGTASPDLSTAIDDINSRISDYGQKHATVSGWDDLRKEFNKKADRAYKAQQKGVVPAADLEAADAYRRAADGIRESQYDSLAQNSDLPPEEIKKLQQLHGIAVKAKMANHASTLGSQKEQYGHEANVTHRILFGRSGERTTYGKGVFSRLFKGGPQGDLNVYARRALRGLEQGGTPERILPEMRTVKQLPQPEPESVEIPTAVTRVIQSNNGPSITGVRVESTAPQRQLPPISGADVQTSGSPEVTGGVFPQRPEISSATKIPSPPRDPRLPELYSYHRNPFYVTDYVGSGARGETPSMPGTANAVVHIDTPEAAQKALQGYDRFKGSAEYRKLDPAAQKRFLEEYSHLKAYAQQGEVGPPRNTPGPTTTVTQLEGDPSRLEGNEAGTVNVTTPDQAKQMLEQMADADWSGLDAQQQAQVKQTMQQLQQLAGYRKAPTGPPGRRMRIEPGTPGKRISNMPRTLTKLGVRGAVGASSSSREKKDLPSLENR